jgi:uncharacterized protein YndB with AHSA1/START domain
MYSIKHLFHINAPRSEVYKAIASVEGLQNWWTVQTSGDVSVGGVLQFRFASHGGPDMKVTEARPGEKVSWECIESTHGWTGTTIAFLLDENEGKTRVRFSHNGWKEQDDNYAAGSFSWARYMESLRQYCQSGKGEAFGSATYKR